MKHGHRLTVQHYSMSKVRASGQVVLVLPSIDLEE